MVKWKNKKDLSHQDGAIQIAVVAKLAIKPDEFVAKPKKKWLQMASRQLDFSSPAQSLLV